MASANGSLALGIDIGTSGVRTACIDGGGQTVAMGTCAMAAIGPDHRDPEIWWQALESALDSLARSADLKAVAAIAVDGTSGTLLGVDADGMPLAPALMYNDPVQDPDILARISQHAPPTSAAHGATSGLAKLIRLQDLPNVVRVLHQADWIAGRLMHRFDTSDENNALKTGYDPVDRRWPDWIEATGARLGLLPDVVAAGTAIGTVAGAAAERFGLAANVKMVAGTTDGCAAFLATGADRPGDGVTSLGSTLVIKLLCDAPLFAPAFGIYSHRIGDVWLAGGASNSGGAVLQNFFDSDTIARLSQLMSPDTPTGLDYYPLLRPGERFPVNDPDFPPRLEPRPADNVRFLQALLEGMASIEAQGYRKLTELGAPELASVRTVGGGARNEPWRKIRGDRLDVPMLPAASEDAAIGSARLALKAIGAGL